MSTQHDLSQVVREDGLTVIALDNERPSRVPVSNVERLFRLLERPKLSPRAKQEVEQILLVTSADDIIAASQRADDYQPLGPSHGWGWHEEARPVSFDRRDQDTLFDLAATHMDHNS